MGLKLAAAIAIICLTAAPVSGEADKPEASQPATVAVLQFKNLCPDATLDWLGFGFAESLCTKLANVEGIQLVERTRLTDAMKELKLQDTAVVDPKTAGKLGKIVGAKYVVIGDMIHAMQDLNKVIELNPKLPEAYFSRALFYIGMGNLALAGADVQKGESLGGVCPPQIKMALGQYMTY